MVHAVSALRKAVAMGTSKGAIGGTILDSSDRAVANAQVTAKDAFSAETRTVKSGPDGGCRFEAVTPSVYTIGVSASGFSRTEVNSVNVQGINCQFPHVRLAVCATEQTDGRL
jgi:hypothetical protein